MNLTEIRHFIALSDVLHFGRAAEELNICQPQLSRSIKRLEARLGFELFKRLSSGVEITNAGLVYLDDVKIAMSYLDNAARKAAAFSKGGIAEISVGFTAFAMRRRLPEVIPHFRKKHPETELRLFSDASRNLVKMLQNGTLSVALLDGRTCTIPDELETITLCKSPYVAAIPAHWPEASKETLNLADLKGKPLIYPPKALSSEVHGMLIDACRNAGFTPKIVQEAGEIELRLRLVALGVGAAVIPEFHDQSEDNVVFRSLTPPSGMTADLVLAWPKAPMSRQVQSLLDIIKKLL